MQERARPKFNTGILSVVLILGGTALMVGFSEDRVTALWISLAFVVAGAATVFLGYAVYWLAVFLASFTVTLIRRVFRIDERQEVLERIAARLEDIE